MDLTLIAANSRRAGADGDVRAPIERVIVSARMLLPLALAQGAAAESELARDLRGRAATDASVALLLPAGRASDSSRLDTGVRQYRLSPALRDAIVAALAGRADTEEAAPLAASPTPSRAWPPSAESSEPVARAQGVGDAAAVRAWAVGAQATAARGGLLAEVSASEALLSAGETAARALARSAGTDVNGSLDAVGGGRAVNFAQALLDGDAQPPCARLPNACSRRLNAAASSMNRTSRSGRTDNARPIPCARSCWRSAPPPARTHGPRPRTVCRRSSNCCSGKPLSCRVRRGPANRAGSSSVWRHTSRPTPRTNEAMARPRHRPERTR